MLSVILCIFHGIQALRFTNGFHQVRANGNRMKRDMMEAALGAAAIAAETFQQGAAFKDDRGASVG